MSIAEHSATLETLTRTCPQASDPRFRLVLSELVPFSRNLLNTQSATATSYFRRLGKSLLRIRGSAHAKLRLDLLDHCCRHLYLTGCANEAIAFAEYAVELARRTRRESDLRKFLCILALANHETGNVCTAVEFQVSAIAIAEASGDRFGRYVCWSNLCVLLVDSGLYREAIACAIRALDFADIQTGTDDDQRARILTNLSLASLRLGDSIEAEQKALKAISMSAPPNTHDTAVVRLVRELNLFMALVVNGKHSVARMHANYMGELAAQFPSPRTTGTARLCQGLSEAYLGDSIKGIEMATVAARSFKGTITPMYVDALSLLVRMYGDLDFPHEALDILEELLAHHESIASKSLLVQLNEIGVRGNHSIIPSGINSGDHERGRALLRARVAELEAARIRQEMLERMAVAADVREDISGEHGYRVGRLSALLAEEIGWERDACSAIDIAARLHDIGKIGIPEKILFDERTLREAEKHFIASHTSVGAEILSKSEIPQVRIAEEIAHFHHEWWDGTGYPKGLKGNAIPKSARIVALADVFDAMTHGRPYAEAISIETALGHIAALRGRQFDPEMTDHFLVLVRRLVASNENLDAYLGKAGRNSPFLKARARIKEMLAQGQDSIELSSPLPPPGTHLN